MQEIAERVRAIVEAVSKQLRKKPKREAENKRDVSLCPSWKREPPQVADLLVDLVGIELEPFWRRDRERRRRGESPGEILSAVEGPARDWKIG
jgi:hypothetical protein